jgi:hypothetical protein
MTPETESRVCRLCHRVKPVDQFVRRAGGRLRRYECRACATVRVQEWRRRKRGQTIEQFSRDVLRGQRSRKSVELLVEELVAAFGSARGLARCWARQLMAEEMTPSARREVLRQFRAIGQLLVAAGNSRN